MGYQFGYEFVKILLKISISVLLFSSLSFMFISKNIYHIFYLSLENYNVLFFIKLLFSCREQPTVMLLFLSFLHIQLWAMTHNASSSPTPAPCSTTRLSVFFTPPVPTELTPALVYADTGWKFSLSKTNLYSSRRLTVHACCMCICMRVPDIDSHTRIQIYMMSTKAIVEF